MVSEMPFYRQSLNPSAADLAGVPSSPFLSADTVRRAVLPPVRAA